MRRLSFRRRVLVYLVLFALIPSSVLMLGGAAVVSSTLSLLTGSQPWDAAAASGRRAIAAARQARLTPEQRAAIDAHEQVLATSLEQSRRVDYLTSRAVVLVVVLASSGVVLLALLASRVAGHLSRQLSRPLSEIVEWTELIARGRALPEGPPRRGAPEFEVLRRRMRKMARELSAAREREVETARLAAFRETARRVAHELKNPLTPIGLAIARLKREADPRLADVVDVLESESRRLEEMARSFAQFGRLPEGPPSEVDLGELARERARALSTGSVPVEVEVDEGLPLVSGHYEALARALSNVLLNAVEACADGGRVSVHVGRATRDGQHVVELRVRDTGCGIPANRVERIWEPYVTSKAGGTGLGLAIVRQTILAHDGTVALSSTEGMGTELVLALPVQPAGELAAAPVS